LQAAPVILAAMTRKTIAMTGAGRLASTLAVRLSDAGYEITEIIARDNPRSLQQTRRLSRKVKSRTCIAKRAKLDASILWFCVPDSKIAAAAVEFAGRDLRNKIALHSSGVLSSDALAVLRKSGAAVASVHPLMTFVQNSQPQLRNVPFAIEGDARAVRGAKQLVNALAGKSFAIRKQDKVTYHAFATMICPLLVALMSASERAAKLAGIPAPKARQRMMPIVRQTLGNYGRLGAAESFSGPLVRGDTETIAQHLAVLGARPALKQVYVALAKAALECLPTKNRDAISRVIS
jgi:predicted short-subunit dehydrogenase-like oxidoreductase (DUF2520 family)